MKIVIPDDYQDMVDKLACYSLISSHDVVRYRAPARDLDELVARLQRRRRRRRHPRAGRVLARAARAPAQAQAAGARRPQRQHHRFQGLHGARHSGVDRQEQLAGRAGRARAGADRRVAPQHRARGGADAARRLAVHAVAPPARLDARHFRARRHRLPGRRRRSRPRHEGAGVGPAGLVRAGARRGLRCRGEQGGLVRALRRALPACAAQARHPRHRRPRPSLRA